MTDGPLANYENHFEIKSSTRHFGQWYLGICKCCGEHIFRKQENNECWWFSDFVQKLSDHRCTAPTKPDKPPRFELSKQYPVRGGGLSRQYLFDVENDRFVAFPDEMLKMQCDLAEKGWQMNELRVDLKEKEAKIAELMQECARLQGDLLRICEESS